MRWNVVDVERLASTFVSLADTLVDDFDVLDALQTLVGGCVDLLEAAAAGLLLADEQQQLRVAVASSERARLMDLFQIQNDEGPCLQCYRSGQPVSADDLDGEQSPWPRFAAAAKDEGFVSVLALPMRLRGHVVGALNLFGDSRTPPISERAIPIAQCMADVATIAILQARLSRGRELLAEQLQVALNCRIAVEQAKGVLSAQLGIDPDEAFGLLRRRARDSRRRLVDVSEEVVHLAGHVTNPK